MKKLLLSMPVLLTITVITVFLSIHQDMGNKSWFWFQRSGSVIVLVGAILGYRSIVRLGSDGVGGAAVSFARVTIVSTNETAAGQKLKVAYSEDTKRQFLEHALDQRAGFLGAGFLVVGTLIWGYGDLLGLMLY